MNRPAHLVFGVILTAIAGFVDAIGFIRLGGLYTSLMSGNTTQLAVAIGDGELSVAVLPSALLGAFFVGSVLGAVITVLTNDRWVTAAILAVEAIAVAIAFALAHHLSDPVPPALSLALAMGAQNAALAHVQGFRAGATFVTGALFAVGQKMVLALAGKAPPLAWLGDGAVWTALLLGAVAGTLAHVRLGIDALALPAATLTLLTLVAFGLAARWRKPDAKA